MTEDMMIGWHHQLNGHEFEQTLGDSEGQGTLACCSPWVHKKSDSASEQQQQGPFRDKNYFFFEKLRNKFPKFRICQNTLSEILASC